MLYTATGVVDPYNPDYLSTRCFGIFQTLEDAMENVINNYCDIWEGRYEFMVIEPLKFGLHQYSANDDQLWFQYNQKIDKFDFITAFFLENIHNIHGIG